MEPTESINLQWDDFEANARVALKELRDEREFCDVTLACADGKQVLSHKVILAGGSTFFQQVLKQNPHPHPLLYLKGVRYEYLLPMLDFMYTGEAHVKEKEINSFLDVANDLQIKGLSEKNPSRITSAKERETIPSNVSHQDERFAVKKDAETPHGNNRSSRSICEEDPIDTSFDVNIKVELDDTIHPTVSFGKEENRADLNGISCVKSNCGENHDPKQVLVDDNIKTKPGDTSSHFNVEEDSDEFLRGFDDKDQVFSECDMTETEPNDSDSKSEYERNAHCWYDKDEKSKDVSVRPDGERGENHNDQEFPTMKTGRKVCSVSGKSLRDSFNLKKHMRTGTGEKPLQCAFCIKTFSRLSNLKVHQRTHTGEKPFQCLVCPKTFGHSSDLKKHTRIHTGEKPFQCLVCSKRFTHSGSLNFHKKQKRCSVKLGE